MANVLVEENTLKNIADSIRVKSGKSDISNADRIRTHNEGLRMCIELAESIFMNKLLKQVTVEELE